MTVQCLLRALTSDRNTTIAIVLDDLHWASQESVDLFVSICTGRRAGLTSHDLSKSRRQLFNNKSSNLVILATYRNEHPSVGLLRKALPYPNIREIELKEFDFPQTHELISKVLNLRSAEDTEELADVVYRKTRGNPDFCRRFLDHLVQKQLLWYSFTKFSWSWDLQKIESDTDVTDNVVQVLTEQIQRLPKQAQDVLQLAGCLGFYFDISILKETALREGVLTARKQLDPDNSLTSSLGRSTSLSGLNRKGKMSVARQAQSQKNRSKMTASMLRQSTMRRSRYRALHEYSSDINERAAKTIWLNSLLHQIELEGLIQRSSDCQYKVSHC